VESKILARTSFEQRREKGAEYRTAPQLARAPQRAFGAGHVVEGLLGRAAAIGGAGGNATTNPLSPLFHSQLPLFPPLYLNEGTKRFHKPKSCIDNSKEPPVNLHLKPFAAQCLINKPSVFARRTPTMLFNSLHSLELSSLTFSSNFLHWAAKAPR
jgi:hypothetical protein